MFRTVSKLSQAAAHPRRGTNITRNGISCKGIANMLHNKRRKSKGEKHLHYQDFNCKKRCKQAVRFSPFTVASFYHFPFVIYHFSFVIRELATNFYE
jgi:hypothetical protein